MLLWTRQGTDLRAHIKNNYGGPDYKLFSQHPLPGVIRNDQVKGVFGTSDLAAAGIRDH